MKIDTLNNLPLVALLKDTNNQTAHEYSYLIPLFAALAGGLIVLVGQTIDRYHKRKIEKKDKLRDIYANCRRIEALLKNYYRQLASCKTSSQYRWYCTIVSKDLSRKQHYNSEHIKYNMMVREIDQKIGEAVADFIGQVRKFQSLKAINNLIEKDLNSISDLNYKFAKEYDENTSKDEIFDLIVEDEIELRNDYFNNLIYFKNINNSLQDLI
ncbi:MAG: hypothetical protein ACOVLG_06585 [Flavobacterium sp.]